MPDQKRKSPLLPAGWGILQEALYAGDVLKLIDYAKVTTWLAHQFVCAATAFVVEHYLTERHLYDFHNELVNDAEKFLVVTAFDRACIEFAK